jgi:hypothetical protein
LVDVEVDAGAMEFGEDALTDGAGFVRGTFCQENHDLTKLLIGSLTYNKRYAQIRLQLALHFLCLDLDSSRTNHVVFAPEDTEDLTPTLSEGRGR